MEALNEVLFLLLGVLLAFLFGWLRHRLQRQSARVEALALLRALSDVVSRDVDHAERFRHKDRWAGEIGEVAGIVRGDLPTIYGDLKRLAWQIEASSFSHEQSDSGVYCCDELLSDLAALQLLVLRELRSTWMIRQPFKRKELERVARDAIRTLIICRDGIAGFRRADEPGPSYDDEYRSWARGDDIVRRLRGDRRIGEPLPGPVAA